MPKLLIAALFAVALTFLSVLVSPAYAQTYEASGTTTSINLLDGVGLDSITEFGYSLSSLPANTTARVRFSRDNSTWYDSSGVENGWDTLSQGSYLTSGTGIDLSTLGWVERFFYYQLELSTSDTAATPVFDQAVVHFDDGPLVYTTAVPGVTPASATISGNITGLTGGNATARGFEYGLTQTGTWNVSESGDFGTGSYSLELSSLSPATTYYVRAFVTNPEGTAYGQWLSFDTSTAFSSSGTMTSENLLADTGVSSVDEFGYNLSSLPANTTVKVRFSRDNSTWYNSSGVQNGWDTLSQGSYLTSGNGIDLSTLGWVERFFYYQLEFSTSDTSYSADLDEVALHYSTGPLLYTTQVSSTTPLSAVVHGNITELSAGSATTRGFEYGLTQTGTWSTNENGVFSTGSYSLQLTGLSANTTYYVRAYATNLDGTAYGEWISFTTSTGFASSGTFTSTNLLDGAEVSSIDAFGYNLSSLPANTTARVRFSRDNSTWYNSSGVQDGWDTLSSGDHTTLGSALDLSTLNWSERYFYYQLELSTSDSTYSPVLDEALVFYTTGPVLTTNNPSSITPTTALASGTISTLTAGNATERGFEYGLTETGTWSVSESGDFGTGSYTLNITGLTAATTYYVRAYATNPDGTGYGPWVNFTTSGSYESSGTFTSTNLLEGQTVQQITSFDYTLSEKPSGTTATVEFSQDGVNWSNPTSTSSGQLTTSTGTLSTGSNSINLCSLQWSGSNFYYRVTFTSSVAGASPVLDSAGISYDDAEETCAASGSKPVPIAEWKLNEGSGQTVHDSSTNGYDGTMGVNSSSNTDDPTWRTQANCKINGCALFDGTADYINIADNDAFSFGNGTTDSPFSVSAWVNMTDATHFKIITKATDTTGTAPEWFIGTDGSDVMAIALYDNTSANQIRTSTTTAVTSYQGSWLHVLATYDGSGLNTGLKLYINGLETAVTPSTAGTYVAMENSTTPVNIGRAWGNDNTYKDWATGYIDEVQLYNSELSADQVKSIYNANAGINLGVGNREDDDLSGGGGNAPLALWNFEEGGGSTTKDSSGNGYNGTITGATWFNVLDKPAYSFGLGGKALEFDGDDYIEVSNVDMSGSFTVEFWLNARSLATPIVFNGGNHIFGRAQMCADSVGRGWSPGHIYFEDNDLKYVVESNNSCSNSSNKDIYTADDAITINEWNHYAVVVTSNSSASRTVKFYKNGVQLTSSLELDQNPTFTQDSNQKTYIGHCYNTSAATCDGLDGYLDGMKFYNYARSTDQIIYNFGRGKPIAHFKLNENTSGTSKTIYDDSGKGNNGTTDDGANNTGMDCTVAGKFGTACQFDGDDYINTVDNPLDITGNITVSAWIKTSNTSTVTVPVSKYSAASDRGWLLVKNAGGNILFDGRTGINSYQSSGASTTNIANNAWHHVVGVREGSTFKIYVDGKMENSANNNSGSFANEVTLNIGRSTLGANYWDGSIDEVQIFNYALSTEQIKKIYNNGAVYFGP